MEKPIRITLLVLALCALYLTVPAFADGSVKAGAFEQVLVDLQVDTGLGEPIDITTRLGQLAVYQNDKFGVAIGIVARAVDFANGSIALEVHEIEKYRGRYRSTGRLEELDALVGDRRSTAGGGSLVDIVVTEFSRVTTSGEHRPDSSSSAGIGLVIAPVWEENQGDDTCCVTCGFTRACGCSVTSSCGDCGSC